MGHSVQEIIALYNPAAPLEQAYTIPAPWYVDTAIEELERRTVFSQNWLVVGRADKVHGPGAYFTTDVAREPVNRCRVIFDFSIAQTDEASNERNRQSIAVSGRVQDEDEAVCVSVQRGLTSRAYVAGRLSVRREKGEHLFHRLLHADLKSGLAAARAAD